MIKLLFVIVYEKEQRVEVAVEDKKGQRRIVNFKWSSKERTPILDYWLETVENELNHQDSEAAAKAEGRQLMGRRMPMAPKNPRRL